jgi:hypothetical protein
MNDRVPVSRRGKDLSSVPMKDRIADRILFVLLLRFPLDGIDTENVLAVLEESDPRKDKIEGSVLPVLNVSAPAKESDPTRLLAVLNASAPMKDNAPVRATKARCPAV